MKVSRSFSRATATNINRWSYFLIYDCFSLKRATFYDKFSFISVVGTCRGDATSRYHVTGFMCGIFLFITFNDSFFIHFAPDCVINVKHNNSAVKAISF